MHLKFIIFVFLFCFSHSKISSQTYAPQTILIETAFGSLKVKLFNETPLHRDNFIKLIQQHYYDSLLFHRIIQGFMIQGGDPDSKHADATKLLGDGDLKYKIPAEILPTLCHKKGMLCAARDGDDVNPKKESSAMQFYIVQGKVRDDNELLNYEKRINKEIVMKIKTDLLLNPDGKLLQDKITMFKENKLADSVLFYTKKLDVFVNPLYEKTVHYKFKPEHINLYKTIGGTPHLDNNYTIFGEVIEGLEIIDLIAKQPTGNADRPVVDIRMKVSLIEK